MKRTLFLNRMVRPYTRMFDITVAAAALILFLIVLYSSYKTNELNNHILINQPLVQLDSYLSDMDNLAHSVMTNELLISKFSELREEGDPDNHFAKNILDAIDTSSILNNITGTRSDIFRISVYNDFGDFVYSGAVVNMREADVHMRSLGVGEIMRNFASAEKDYILLEPVLDPWSTIYKSDYLSFIRPIMNIYSRDVVGVVEIQKNTETLISSVYLDVTSDKKINIYNERGEAVLLQPDSDNYNVAAVVTSNLYGWRIDLLENKNDFLSRLVQILLSITLGCVVIIFLVRYLVGRITREIARPLETLKNAVESIDVINPTRIDTAAIDIEEVYSVANSFNTLMENVTFLKEQEKKTHLLALQAQMNPHFLYNVLSIINAAAIEGRAETVLDIVDNLSDMLRYTSAYETGLVKMEDEARYTEQYLKLMKARYAEMFTYEVQIEESVRDISVPKLVIQPLCENCFKHGFANIEPPYRIQAWIRSEEHGWSVEVRDNGKGFSADERALLISKTEEADIETLSDMQIGGLGVFSSIVRTRIVTGKKVTCEITDIFPKGACVKLNVFDG